MQDLDLDLALVLKQTQSESAVVVKPFLVIHLFVQNLKLDKLNMSHLTSMHKSKDPAKGHKYETFFPPSHEVEKCYLGLDGIIVQLLHSRKTWIEQQQLQQIGFLGQFFIASFT